MVMSFYQVTRPDGSIESFYTIAKQIKIDYFFGWILWSMPKNFEALGCYCHFCPCREAQPNLSADEIEFGIRKRESDSLGNLYLEKEGYRVIEMRECDWWDHVQESSLLKKHVRKKFPYKLNLNSKTLLKWIHKDNLFGYVQWDLEVPEELPERVANFPPIFQNCNVGREKMGKFMLEYAEKTRKWWNHIECWFWVTN